MPLPGRGQIDPRVVQAMMARKKQMGQGNPDKEAMIRQMIQRQQMAKQEQAKQMAMRQQQMAQRPGV